MNHYISIHWMLVLEKPQRLYGADVHENCEEPHSPRGCEHPNTEPLGVTSAPCFLGFHDIPNSSNSLCHFKRALMP